MKGIDQDIFNLKDQQPQPQPQRGSLLVAKPVVGDFFFRRSVVMMVDPDEGDGAMGVVLNHFTGYNLRDVVPEIDTEEEVPLFLGGPVGTQAMFYIHTLGPEVIPNAVPLQQGVYFGGDFDAMKRYLALGYPVRGNIKFMVGYSGWSSGQLASEIERNDWAVLPSFNINKCPWVIKYADDEIWRDAVTQFGNRYRLWLNMPSDPRYN